MGDHPAMFVSRRTWRREQPKRLVDCTDHGGVVASQTAVKLRPVQPRSELTTATPRQ
jgi:hypothetical protein